MKNFFEMLRLLAARHRLFPSRAYKRKLCGTLLGVAFAFTGAAQAQGVGYWHTSGNQILDSNNTPVRIAGVNWYGFETTDQVVHGLWAQDYRTILDTIKNNGYNVVRLPFSNQIVESPTIPGGIHFSNNSGPINSDLQGLTSMQIMDKIITYAGQIGLRVILDNHRSEAGDSTEANGLWYTSQYPESSWIQDWKALAQRYLTSQAVIGVDLRNEPHNANSGGACWGCGGANDWQLAAQRGGNAVLSVNPNLLIIVEGTDCYNGDCTWYGGNLQGVQNSSVALNTTNRLVYSAHEYGPTEYAQSWFNNSTSYQSLVSLWTKYWAYIDQHAIAPVLVGEFGTTNDAASVSSSVAGSQGQWFQAFTSFLYANPTLNWTYWALNGEDRYGLLNLSYDSTPVNSLRQQMLAGIQSPLSTSSSGSGSGTGTPAPLQIPAAPSNLTAFTVSASQVNLAWSASATSNVTYNVYVSTTQNFLPSRNTLLISNTSSISFQHKSLNSSTTYFYLVTASNAAGESAASNRAMAKTPAGGVCQAALIVTQDWEGGFNANISLTNTGSSPINGWTLTWTWPSATEHISNAWNSSYTQNGSNVTISATSVIQPGAPLSTGTGITVSYSGPKALPHSFSLNGRTCTSDNAAKYRPVPDFDSDGQFDSTVWRPANGTWYVIPSSNSAAPIFQQWGLPGDVPVPGDYDGDGKTDFAVWRLANGTWYIMPSSNPSTPIIQQWGLPKDVPVPGDYDGDGKTDFAVWRPANGTWYIVPSSNPSALVIQQWGLPGDIPLTGDFDNDGLADFAVWRPANGTWYVIPSGNPSTPIIQQWGLPGDIPLTGDFDNDGKLDFAVWRPTNGTWYIMPSSTPSAPLIKQWGLNGDTPLIGDFDGDGKLDYIVWRPANGTWYVIPSGTPSTPLIRQWGLPGDVPIQAKTR